MSSSLTQEEIMQRFDALVKKAELAEPQFVIDPDQPLHLQLLNVIDEKYEWAAKQRLGRLSDEWGIWSRQMNLIVKEKQSLAETSEEKAVFGLLFSYWVTVSALLELRHKHRFPAEDVLTKTIRTRFRIRKEIEEYEI